MMNRASIIGKNLENSMVAELNRRLAAVTEVSEGVYDPHCDDTNSLALEIIEMTATVYGRNLEAAYACFEMIAKGSECSPFILSIPLRGSKSSETWNKEFYSRIHTKSRSVIVSYCRDITALLSYAGDGKSVAESAINPILIDCGITVNDVKTYVFDNPTIGKQFLTELNVSKGEDVGIIIITSSSDGTNLFTDDLHEQLDLQAQDVGGCFVPDAAKAELIAMCRKLSAFHHPHTMALFDIQFA